MTGTDRFGLLVLVIGLVGMAAVLSNRLSARLRVPAPAFFLICASVAAQLWPRATMLPLSTVQRVVTIALAIILFDGGMHIGWRRFRTAAAAIVWVGVAGTLVTAAGAAAAAHFVAGMDWRLALLVGTAVAATDPAVVFSVFGRREIAGRTGVLLEGESGANDPVGIALLGALLAAQGTAGGVAWHVVTEFALQMAVGTAVGVAGGIGLLAFMRRVPLPSEGLYAPRVLVSVLCIFGIAVVAQGSGFLAVFVAGILIGDEPAPYKREIQRFHSSLASLAEIVAFVMLGLTMRLSALGNGDAWPAGLAIAALLAFVIRPVFVGLVSLPVRLSGRERVFFLWTGLKGAVPDPAGHHHRRVGHTRRRQGLRGHLRHRRLLRDVPGRPGAGAGPPPAHPAAHRGAGTVVARRPVQPGAGGPAPLPRGRGIGRRRQRHRRPAMRGGRLGQPHHQERRPGHRGRRHHAAGRRRRARPRRPRRRARA